jgi:hypothetical protein
MKNMGCNWSPGYDRGRRYRQKRVIIEASVAAAFQG